MNELFMIFIAALFLTLFVEYPFVNLKHIFIDQLKKKPVAENGSSRDVEMKEI